jgi:uncharacterized protein (DUF1800 family)
MELARFLVSRATFGARPEDVEQVSSRGGERWLEEQLHPDRIDDSALEARLVEYPDLSLSTSELLKKYPRGESTRRDIRKLILELSHTKILRAIHSQRQLQEVLSDFWFNHFNVYAGKNRNVAFALPSYEREAIRPRVLGNFQDLLRATAEHPAMLHYLDNWLNFKEGFDPRAALRGKRRRMTEPQEREEPRRFGINENYARELLELHTLGVDGGYGQGDVVEVARAFTGWSVVSPRSVRFLKKEEGSFSFVAQAHDEGPKTVLGKRLVRTGANEGMEVIEMLSRHPSTARFLSTKLARRFVAEEPPRELIEEMSQKFLESGGDVREVTKTMFLSPSSLAAARAAELVKTPFELLVSALRATSIDSVGPGLVRTLFELGMPLYLCQPPTGYEEASSTWLSAGSVLSRVRFAADLAAGRIPGVGAVGSEMGLTVGSPEFQRH